MDEEGNKARKRCRTNCLTLKGVLETDRVYEIMDSIDLINPVHYALPSINLALKKEKNVIVRVPAVLVGAKRNELKLTRVFFMNKESSGNSINDPT